MTFLDAVAAMIVLKRQAEMYDHTTATLPALPIPSRDYQRFRHRNATLLPPRWQSNICPG